MVRDSAAPERLIPLRKIIPNLITTTALCCGLASLHFSIRAEPDWRQAVGSIVFAGVFDALDGRAARLLRVSSKFGAMLDSLSDFLCFGVAPAIILYKWGLGGLGALGLAPVMLFALCSALRLARFTAAVPEKTDSSKPSPTANYFSGMPTPAAAGAVLIPIMLTIAKPPITYEMPKLGASALTVVVALLMISRRPMFAFKKLKVRRAFVVPILVFVGLLVACAVIDTWLTIASLAGAYLLSAPLSMWTYHRAAVAGGQTRNAWSAGPPLRETLRERR